MPLAPVLCEPKMLLTPEVVPREAPPTLDALELRPKGPMAALARLLALARLCEAALPAPLPEPDVPCAPVDAIEVVAAVPMGGEIRLSVPAVAPALPVPFCAPAEFAEPKPKPLLALLVVPVDIVWARLMPPPNGLELACEAAPVELAVCEMALNVPRVLDAFVPPVACEDDDAEATCACAPAAMTRDSTATEEARKVFLNMMGPWC